MIHIPSKESVTLTITSIYGYGTDEPLEPDFNPIESVQMSEEHDKQPGLLWSELDIFYMRHALKIAENASRRGEVPIGAVIAGEGGIISEASNQVEACGDPTAHAELIALRLAAKAIGRHELSECTLYVTLEPCVMCAGGVVNARLKRLCFGARDERFGGCRSIYRITDDPRLNHRLKVAGNLLGDEAKRQLGDFFAQRRLQI